MKVVKAGNISIANDLPFILIAGPCALESRDVAFRCAESLIKTTDELKIPFIFKSSFDKANRTSLNARRGVPMEEALKIFRELKEKFGCLISTIFPVLAAAINKSV